MKPDHPFLRPMIEANSSSAWTSYSFFSPPFCLFSPQKAQSADFFNWLLLWRQICTHELGPNFCTSAHFAKCDPTLFQPACPPAPARHNVITKARALDTALHLVVSSSLCGCHCILHFRPQLVLDWIESILALQIGVQYFVQYDIGFPFSTGDCKQINDPGGNNGHNASLQIMFIVEKQPQ